MAWSLSKMRARRAMQLPDHADKATLQSVPKTGTFWSLLRGAYSI